MTQKDTDVLGQMTELERNEYSKNFTEFYCGLIALTVSALETWLAHDGGLALLAFGAGIIFFSRSYGAFKRSGFAKHRRLVRATD